MLVNEMNKAFRSLPHAQQAGGTCKFRDLAAEVLPGAMPTLGRFIADNRAELEPPFALMDGRQNTPSTAVVLVYREHADRVGAKIFHVKDMTVERTGYISAGHAKRSISTAYGIAMGDILLEKMEIKAESIYGPYFRLLQCMLQTLSVVAVPTAPWGLYRQYLGARGAVLPRAVHLAEDFARRAEFVRLQEELVPGDSILPVPPQPSEADVLDAMGVATSNDGDIFNYQEPWPGVEAVYDDGDLTDRALHLVLSRLCNGSFFYGAPDEDWPCIPDTDLSAVAVHRAGQVSSLLPAVPLPVCHTLLTPARPSLPATFPSPTVAW